MPDSGLKYVASVDHVREVALLGTANLEYWTKRLGDEGLTPDEDAGQARILITTAEGKFKGIRFRELSVAVLVANHERQAAFLVQAFNSIRFFAFCERVLFSTPYRPGDVRIDTAIPASIQLNLNDGAMFAAAMGVGHVPSRTGVDGWDGPVFLPKRGKHDQPIRWFHARIHGQTQTFPFQTGSDELTIKPGGDHSILHALIDSGFVAREWSVRPDAHHAKSKTYKGLPK